MTVSLAASVPVAPSGGPSGSPSGDQRARYRPTVFPSRDTLVDTRADGTVLLRCATPPGDLTQHGLPEFLPHWAARRGALPVFRERDARGEWRSLGWADLWLQVQAVGAALLEMGLGQDRPLMLLSGNSIEQAVLLLAAEYVGVPTAPVSPAYSLLSRDFARLRSVAELVPPAAVFVQSAAPFERAIAALACADAPVIAVEGATDGATEGQVAWSQLAATELTPARLRRLAEAHAAIRPEQPGRILFTSGSTGTPKGVALSYRNLAAVATYFADTYAALTGRQPAFLCWLPWHHGLGGVLSLSRTVVLGGTHHIDDGRPLPGQFERTVRNLREVSPAIFTSVPSAWTMLAAELERDPALAASLFANAVNFSYGGASLPRDVWDRIHRAAEATVGERIAFCSGLACTETSGMGIYCTQPTDQTGNVGVPMPGCEVKLVPLEGGDGRYEIRMRGPFVFAGYVKRPDLTAAAFDDEGYFCLGDAVRLANPADPACGVTFAGRVVEDFKLTNGTWVRTGAVRLGLVEQCAPLITDAVICGHDHDYLAALAWPNLAACRRLAPELADADAQTLVRHPVVVHAIRERLKGGSAGASLAVRRVLLMAEPPSIDANEIADKGYVNQAATRARRAHLVDELFQTEPAPHVACAS
ncbi:Long-chain-fatty-acid--CoA ligase FadD15 [Cupriavidus yeoncheonensis]|uniref:Long-chain-fatty-acid--CoA ligase FadD15 n=1 Tax=Cupriavidus yeoncheonensis TaxID=1462994 RepID=A0A916N546_9BURK|nr:feruloyl-CoA synthase [Cupriavidus yeoncheonensis]CAG2146652.1 Long-chain-fatty-acid--CoA ligase FadD15 [Cupriavidus yeoncheonensis]